MSRPMRFYRTYTPAQYELAAELWGRLLDSGRVSLKNDDYGTYLEKVTEEHLLQLVMSDGAQTHDYPAVTVTLISYSDHGSYGSDIDAANVRALENTPGVQTDAGTYEGQAWTQLGELPGDLDDDVDTGLEWLKSLVETIEALNDYPFINENTYFEYEEERREAAWVESVRDEVISELNDWAGDGNWADFGYSEDQLREMFDEAPSGYWEFERLSMVRKHQDDDVEWIKELVLREWLAPLVDPNQVALVLTDFGTLALPSDVIALPV
jgi:hypothetical protein